MPELKTLRQYQHDVCRRLRRENPLVPQRELIASACNNANQALWWEESERLLLAGELPSQGWINATREYLGRAWNTFLSHHPDLVDRLSAARLSPFMNSYAMISPRREKEAMYGK